MKNFSFSSHAALKYLRAPLQVLGAFAAASFAASAAHAESVSVSGIALNATKMKPAVNLELELIKPNAAEQNGTLVAKIRTGADGRFRFPPQDVDKKDLLLIRAPYKNYGYLAAAYDGAGALKPFGVTPKPNNVQVSVYESATRPPALRFQVHHLAIESSPKGIKCIERIVVENPSNSTYTGVGDVKGTVILDIPKGAREVKMDPKIPGRLVQTSHGWAATTPIAPSAYTSKNPLAGPNAIIFEYLMDWPSALPWARKVSLSQKILYPTNFFFVARKTDDKVLRVSAPRLGKDEEQQLPIGDTTEVRLVNAIGRPVATKPVLNPDEQIDISVAREVNPLFWAFCAFLGAIALGVPLALRGGRRKAARAEHDEYDEYEDDPEADFETVARHEAASASGAVGANGSGAHDVERGAERGADARVSTAYSAAGTSAIASLEALASTSGRTQVEAIAALDDDFEAGRLDEAEYQRRRAASKQRLLDLLESAPASRSR